MSVYSSSDLHLTYWWKILSLKALKGSFQNYSGFESCSLRHFKFKNTRKVSFSTVSGFLFVKTYLYWLNPVLSNERTEHGHPQNQTRPRNRLPERGRRNLLFPHIRSTEHAGQSASKLVTRKKQTTDSTSEIMEKIHFVTVAVLNPISVICYSI